MTEYAIVSDVRDARRYRRADAFMEAYELIEMLPKHRFQPERLIQRTFGFQIGYVLRVDNPDGTAAGYVA